MRSLLSINVHVISVGMLLVIVWLTSKNDEENLNTKKENQPIMFKENIDKFNITSVQVASEMAMGALMRSGANLAIAVTGVAGPNGGTQEIPVGTVAIVFAARIRDTIKTKEKLYLFSGDRNEIREMVVQKSLVDCVDFFETFKNKMIGVS